MEKRNIAIYLNREGMVAMSSAVEKCHPAQYRSGCSTNT
jgi:hypothetical protein